MPPHNVDVCMVRHAKLKAPQNPGLNTAAIKVMIFGCVTFVEGLINPTVCVVCRNKDLRSAQRPRTPLGRSGGPYHVTTQFYYCLRSISILAFWNT